MTVPAFLDRKPLVWTYTMLKTYRDVCAHQTYRKYILKDVPYTPTPEMARGNAVHDALELRVGAGKPLPTDMHDYERFARAFDGKNPKCEPKLAVTRDGKSTSYFDRDVWGRGRADVCLVQDDRAYFCDWKTGKVREDPFELEVQAVLLKAKYPNLRVIKGQYAWLKEMTLGPVHDLSHTAQTWGTIQHLVKLIEADRAKGEFDKEPGPLCGWCEISDCAHNKNPKVVRAA